MNNNVPLCINHDILNKSHNQNFLTISTLLIVSLLRKTLLIVCFWLYHASATKRHCITSFECSNSRSNTKRFNLILLLILPIKYTSPKQTPLGLFIWGKISDQGGTSHVSEILLHPKNVSPELDTFYSFFPLFILFISLHACF